ncbi:NAD(P)-dependent oxidoreductase [Amycolatopsis acidicola]|uniref:NAD(P)-dependent oxidoreductase n=2 Tax=Amycolatopsis acidicola TaxID=2596893 RepID=A0A5N0VEW9_9PSEU|nr:NAD(P)-dependent oxidoreductase [Amycolatopsis acidicola]KAA9163232.1 NAD(P)-dependent oxidoreductase [Amycolatopsis acidicola]
MTIGYVGLGAMGGALAARLLRKHPLLVHDKDRDTTAHFEELGAVVARSAAEVASGCDTIFLCLPTSDHVRSVVFGRDGLLGSARPGTTIIDQTTGDPHATREMAEELARHEVTLVDAPVSGGRAGAAAGTIAIMIGASATGFARVRPVLGAISPNVFHAGPVGAGHTIKLVNNLLSGAQRFLAFEGVALAAKNGIDPRTAVEILQASGGRNAYLERVMIPQVVEGRLDIGFTLGLAHKDVRLACELGGDSGVPTPYGDLTLSLLQNALDENGAGAQVDTAARIVDRLAGTRVVPS